MKMAWYFVQTLMGCIGSVGFAVLFNIRGRKLLLAAEARVGVGGVSGLHL